MRPLVAKVAAITKMPPPTMVKDLLRYLGMLNYYRRFLPAAAQVLKPLTEVLRGNVARNKQLTWSLEMSASFAASKQLLDEAVPLAHPNPTTCIGAGELMHLKRVIYKKTAIFLKKLQSPKISCFL